MGGTTGMIRGLFNIKAGEVLSPAIAKNCDLVVVITKHKVSNLIGYKLGPAGTQFIMVIVTKTIVIIIVGVATWYLISIFGKMLLDKFAGQRKTIDNGLGRNNREREYEKAFLEYFEANKDDLLKEAKMKRGKLKLPKQKKKLGLENEDLPSLYQD